MTEEEGSLVQWRVLMVDEKPYCMWGSDLTEQNERFLRDLDPAFFNHVVEAQIPLLSGTSKQHAAMTIRTTYAHALETFFALACAAVQAPHCPLGWILQYQPGDVPRVVRKIHEGLPLPLRIALPARWKSLSEQIHLFQHSDPAEDLRIKTLFAEAWALLAHDYLDRSGSEEYNSVKHGLRVKAGGFSFTMGDEGAPILKSASEFGSKFFHPEPLGTDRTNFYANDAARNWSPVALAVRIELLCLSIANVVSFLKTKNHTSETSVSFKWPEPQDNLSLAWKVDFAIQSMVGGAPVEIDAEALKTKDEIREVYGWKIQ
jgi:hypothetical protein